MQRQFYFIKLLSVCLCSLVFVNTGLGNYPADTDSGFGSLKSIKNNSFEEANVKDPNLPRYWDKWLSDAAQGDIRITEAEKAEGRRSLQMTYSQGWKADRWVRAIQRFKGLKPNTPYTLTAYGKLVKGEGAHRGLSMFLGNRWTCYDLLRDQWEKEWKKITINFMLDPADIDGSGNILIVIQLDVPGVYCLDDIRIRPYNPIETIQARDLEKYKIYLIKKEAEVNAGSTAIPPGLPVYSVSADGERKSKSDLSDTYARLSDIKGKHDLSATYALAYSDKGLHLYVDVIDDVVYIEKNYLSLTPEKNEGLYNVDSIQVSIDQGLERTSRWDDNDLEFGFALGQQPEKPQTWCWTLGRGLDREDGRWSVTRTPKGYFVDALLTWKFLDKIDRRGKKAFGFNLLVNDNDGKGRKGWISVSRGIGEVKYTQDNIVAILDDGNTNPIGLFKAAYTGSVSAPLLLYSLDKLNGRVFNLLVRDEQGKTQPLLFKPYKLDIPPNSLGLIDADFSLDAFKSGTITVQVLADEKPVKEFSFKKIGLQESLGALEKEIAGLAGKVDELKRKNKPTGYPASKLAVLSSQTLYAKDNLADYAANHSAYYLGKAIRRISENESLLKMTKQELADIAKGDKNDRFKTYRYITSPIRMKEGYPWARTVDDFGQTAVRPLVFNGYCMGIDWNIEEHPGRGKTTLVKMDTGEKVEVTGTVGTIIDQPSLANSSMSFFKNLSLLKRMGGNAMVEMCKPTWSCQLYDFSCPKDQGPPFQPAGFREAAKNMGPVYYNSFHDRFSQFMESAYKNDFLITWNLWSISFFPWAFNTYPEMYIPAGIGGGFAWFNYQVNTPGARKLLGFLTKNVVREIREDKWSGSVHSFDIANETAFSDCVYDIPFQKSLFLSHLKRKYANAVQNLNAVWKSHYKTFEEVLAPDAKGLTPDNRVLWWEWHVYAREAFNDWHKWLAGVVREAWPAVLVYAKPMAGGFGMTSANVEYEAFSEWMDINSCDTFLYYREGDYISTWLDASLNYDLMTSLKRTTILNAENHIIRDAEGRDIPYDYVYTTLFQQYMHGLSLSSTWSWMEQREDTGYPHVKGLFAERPMCIVALNQATMDANRLIYEIKAFFDEKPKVAILYSPTSLVKDTHQPDPKNNYHTCGVEVYKLLDSFGYKVGFISEKQIARKEFGDLGIIIAPKTIHALPSTAQGLRDFVAKGKTVLSIGRSLQEDPYDAPLSPTVPMVRMEQSTNPAEFAKALKSAIEARIGKSPIDLTVNHDIPDGIEWRLVKYKDGYLANIVNYNKEPREVVLTGRPNADLALLDLITYEPLNKTFTLAPLRPLLIKITPAVPKSAALPLDKSLSTR
jgi:hypothetical protein